MSEEKKKVDSTALPTNEFISLNEPTTAPSLLSTIPLNPIQVHDASPKPTARKRFQHRVRTSMSLRRLTNNRHVNSTLSPKVQSPMDTDADSDASSDENLEESHERMGRYYARAGLTMAGDTEDEDEEGILIHSQYSQSLEYYQKVWFKSLIRTTIWIVLFMIPGLVCQYLAVDQCATFFGQPIFLYSIIFASAMALWLIVKILVFLLFFIIQSVSFLATRFSFYTSHVESPVRFIVWVALCWSFWRGLLDPVFINTPLLIYEWQTFLSLLILGLGFFAKCVLMRVATIKFHRAAFLPRIRQAVLAEYVMSAIVHRRQVLNIANNESNFLSNKNISLENLKSRRISRRSFLPWNAREAPHVECCIDHVTLSSVRITEKDLIAGSYTTYEFGLLVEYLKRNRFVKSCTALFKDKQRAQGIRSALRHVSDFLFFSLIGPENQRRELFRDDFEPLFKQSKLVRSAFALFDGNLDGSLTRHEFFSALVALFKERRALSKSLHDGELAISQLNTVATSVTLFLVACLTLIVFGVDVTGILVTLSSLIVALSFAFGNLIKKVVDAIQFLFGSHPFDVGDRVCIQGQIYMVHKLHILSTELIRYDNTKVFYPNDQLSQEPIENYRRSPDMFDLIQLDISYDTTAEQMRQLDSGLTKLLAQHSMHFYRTHEIEVCEARRSNIVSLRVWVQQRHNRQNMKRYRERHSFIVMQIKALLTSLSIIYYLPVQRIEVTNESLSAFTR